jgi:hypothetical protein
MTDDTILKLGDIYFPPGSARGISQSLNLVSNGELLRTVNGTLIDLTRDENRKFTSVISASETASPTLQGLWRGQVITGLECIQPFRQFVAPANTSVTLIRPEVTGSVVGRLSDNTRIDPDTVVAQVATFSQAVVAVEYRPVLDMMVDDITVDNDEYAATEGWSISLVEV